MHVTLYWEALMNCLSYYVSEMKNQNCFKDASLYKVTRTKTLMPALVKAFPFLTMHTLELYNAKALCKL